MQRLFRTPIQTHLQRQARQYSTRDLVEDVLSSGFGKILAIGTASWFALNVLSLLASASNKYDADAKLSSEKAGIKAAKRELVGIQLREAIYQADNLHIIREREAKAARALDEQIASPKPR